MQWFRSYHGMPTDPRWRSIARRIGQRPSDVWHVYSALYDFASQHAARGSIGGFDVEVEADFLDLSDQDVEVIIAALRSRGIITEERLTDWEKQQPKRGDDLSTVRVRRFRQRQAAEAATETPNRAFQTTVKRIRNAPESESDQNRTEERERTRAPAGAPLTLAVDLPDEWREEARAERQRATLGPVNLDAEWGTFRTKFAAQRRPPAEGWPARWLRWVLNARAAPGEVAVVVPVEPSAAELERIRKRTAEREAGEREAQRRQAEGERTIDAERAALRAFWADFGDDPKAWKRHDLKWLLWLQDWAVSGKWPAAIAGPAPSEAGCLAPEELVAYVQTKRRERDANPAVPPVRHPLGVAGERLKAELGEAVFVAWCAALDVAIDGGRLIVAAPTGMVRSWLRQHESELLRAWRPEAVTRVEVVLQGRPPVADAAAMAAEPPAAAAPPRKTKRKPAQSRAQSSLLLSVKGGVTRNGHDAEGGEVAVPARREAG